MNLLLLAPDERELPRHDRRARHIRKVLKLRPGDVLRAGEVGGRLGTARVLESGADSIRVSFEPTVDPLPLPPIELVLGHPRPIVLRRLLRDLTALGPGAIVVTVTDLGEKSYYAANLWDDTRTPMLEGAAQGGTTLLPRLERTDSLSHAMDSLRSSRTRRLVLHPTPTPTPTPSLNGALGRLSRGREASDPDEWVSLAVGSERGWTERELALLRDAGFESCTLGNRILRTETAATVALWAAVSWYHERP